MSLDLLQGPNAPNSIQEGLRGRVMQPINDLVFLFGGWGQLGAGGPLPDDGSGSAELVRRVRRLSPTPGHQLVVHAFSGELRLDVAIPQASRLLWRGFHPLGKLIIYGYSAGGFSAMRFTHHIYAALGFYELPTGAFYNQPYSNDPRPAFGRVRVDMLITVDAATGPTSGIVSRRVFPSVRNNLNYYQTVPSPILSHGGPNEAVDPNSTQIENHDITSRFTRDPAQGHSQIDESTVDEALRAIQGSIGIVYDGRSVPDRGVRYGGLLPSPTRFRDQHPGLGSGLLARGKAHPMGLEAGHA